MMKITVGKSSRKNLRRLYITYAVLMLLLLPYLAVSVLFDMTELRLLMILFLLLVILVFTLIIPGLSYLGSIWEVDEHYFRHIVFNSYLDKCRMFYHRPYAGNHVALKLKNIDYIIVDHYCRVNYPSRFLYSDAGYPVVIRFYMQDGSQYQFEKMLSDDRQTTIAAFTWMKKRGVRIIDKHHILSAYQQGLHLQQYLKEISHD